MLGLAAGVRGLEQVNCPACGYPENSIIRTERAAKADRRRHECRCGIRWSSVATIEKGSITMGAATATAPKGVSKRTRFAVLRRDGFACRYCGVTGVELVLDHVTPLSAPIPEGRNVDDVIAERNSEDNLVTACIDCNAGKSASIGVVPPAISRPPNSVGETKQTAGNNASTGEVYSESGIPVRIEDPNSGSLGNPERERARSTQGAEFVRLLKIFTDRWERSNRRAYPVTAADRNQLGRFMKHNGNYIEGFPGICDRYVSDRQQFTIQRSGNHRLAWLLTTGLAMYGGVPRETSEQYSARLRSEHETRKHAARRPPTNPAMRDLIAELAEKKAVAG